LKKSTFCETRIAVLKGTGLKPVAFGRYGSTE
jgi:hypothetical protein